MPSGWSWLCVTRRQHETEVTSKRTKPRKTRKESSSGASSKRKLFGFRWLRGKGDDSVGDFGNVKENHSGALQSAPLFPHDASKSKGIERSLDEDFREEMKQLEERIEGTNFTKRPRAYEIFQDQPPSPQCSHVSEPCLNQGSVSPDLMRDRGGQGRGSAYGRLPEGRERERREGERRRGGRGESVGQYAREDLKPRKDNNFLSRIPPQAQLRSPPRGRVLGQERGSRQLGARRSESMYAYVPRAVSLHDASALLFGQEKEDVKRGHLNMGLDRFATTPTVEEDLTRPMSASPRLCHRSSPFTFVTSASVLEAEGEQVERTSSRTSYEHSSGTTTVIPCTGPGNEAKVMQVVKGSRENIKDHEELTRQGEMNSSVLGIGGSYSRIDSPLSNERKTTNVERDSLKDYRTNNKPLKETSPMIIDNCLFSAGSNSQQFAGSDGSRDNEDNDSDVSSLLAHFDKLNGNDGQSHVNSKQLEGIFGSPGEVLY